MSEGSIFFQFVLGGNATLLSGFLAGNFLFCFFPFLGGRWHRMVFSMWYLLFFIPPDCFLIPPARGVHVEGCRTSDI